MAPRGAANDPRPKLLSRSPLLTLPDFTLRPAAAADNRALCDLARDCPQGVKYQFYHAREDAGERRRTYQLSETLVAARGSQIAGAGTVAIKSVGINGTLHRVAYLFDQMVHPASRRLGVARALLGEQLRWCQDCGLQYCIVLEENTASRRLMESVGFTAHPHRLLYFALLPRRAPGEHALHITERRPVPQGLSAVLADLLQQTHNLVDEPAESGDALFTLGDLPHATAVRYRHGAKVLVHAPRHYRWLRGLLPWLPRLQQPIHAWGLSHLHWQDQASLARLLGDIAWVANQEGIAVVLIPLFANDARIAEIRPLTIHRWGIPPTRACVYLRGELGLQLLHSPQPLLASARDG